MTPPRRGRALVVLGLLGALSVTGCGQEREGARIPRDVDQPTTAATASVAEVERRAAESVFTYVSGRNSIRRAPTEHTGLSISSIGYADGRRAKSLLADAGELAAAGHKQVGTAELTGNPEVLDVELRPTPEPGQKVAPAPYVTLRGCLDESDTHLVDAKGRKVTGSEGTGPRAVKYHVINRHWPSMATWQVAWIDELKTSC